MQNGGWLKIKIKYTLNWLQDVFSIDEHYWLIQDENRKVQEHLDQVCKQLKKLFQVIICTLSVLCIQEVRGGGS